MGSDAAQPANLRSPAALIGVIAPVEQFACAGIAKVSNPSGHPQSESLRGLVSGPLLRFRVGPCRVTALVRYLITGGSGYIGSRLVELLAEREDTERILICDVRPPRV